MILLGILPGSGHLPHWTDVSENALGEEKSFDNSSMDTTWSDSDGHLYKSAQMPRDENCLFTSIAFLLLFHYCKNKLKEVTIGALERQGIEFNNGHVGTVRQILRQIIVKERKKTISAVQRLPRVSHRRRVCARAFRIFGRRYLSRLARKHPYSCTRKCGWYPH